MLEFASLTKLPAHGWQIMLSFTVWNIMYYLVSFVYKKRKFFVALSNARQRDFVVCHVSLVHATGIVALALPMLFDSNLVNDKIHGYTFYSGSVIAITTGYFIWDTILCLFCLQGYQFTFHAISCLLLFLLSFVITHFNRRNQYSTTLVRCF